MGLALSIRRSPPVWCARAARWTSSTRSSSESAIGFDLFFDPVGPLDPHVVAAVDVDVLDVVLVEEQLQAAEAELGGHQAADDLLLLLGGRRGHAPSHHGAGRLVDGLAGQLLDERAALAFAHAGRAVADDPVGHVLGGVTARAPGARRRSSDAPPRSIRSDERGSSRAGPPAVFHRETRRRLVRRRRRSVVVVAARWSASVCSADLGEPRSRPVAAASMPSAPSVSAAHWSSAVRSSRFIDRAGWPARPRPPGRRAWAGARRPRGSVPISAAE